MRSRDLLLLALLVAALGLGLLHLFRLRYVSGDVYRPYSSLRADPLGTKALHDALAELDGLKVERSLRPTHLLPGDGETALMVLGARSSYPFPLNDLLAEDLDRIAREGARVVVALAPWITAPEPEDEEGDREDESERTEGDPEERASDGGEPAGGEAPPGEADQHEADPGSTGRLDDGEASGDGDGSEPGDGEPLEGELLEDPESDERQSPRRRRVGRKKEHETPSARLRWGLRLDFEALQETDRDEPIAAVVERVAGDPLPGTLGWRSSIVLDEADPAWRVLYERGGRPVVVEQQLGLGSLVLATDAYFASNEALHEEPQPALLAWLVGERSRVVFEETHLGTADSPGVVELARRYRLHGLALGLAGLAGLLVWRQAGGFIPTYEQAGHEASDAVLGRGSTEGLTDLLRRGIAPKTLVATCIREWAGTSQDRRETARALLALARQTGTPVEAYRRVALALEKKGET